MTTGRIDTRMDERQRSGTKDCLISPEAISGGDMRTRRSQESGQRRVHVSTRGLTRGPACIMDHMHDDVVLSAAATQMRQRRPSGGSAVIRCMHACVRASRGVCFERTPSPFVGPHRTG